MLKLALGASCFWAKGAGAGAVARSGRVTLAARPALRTTVDTKRGLRTPQTTTQTQTQTLRNHSLVPAMASAGPNTLRPSGGLQVERVNCLSDNYVWVLKEPSGKVAIIDPSEVKPVTAALEQLGWKPDYIFNTHHHWDHTGGNEELKKKYGLQIVGPKADEKRIPGIDIPLGEGDSWQFGELELHVFDTPGHTRGHITLYFPGAQAVFPGDTLFAMGCGRLFEGSPQQMWNSLSKIRSLPNQTVVYPAHEYTQSNAKWALAVNPNNKDLQARKADVDDLRSKGKCTLPCTLELELRTNPFLRPEDTDIRNTLGLKEDASNLDVFTAVRRHKDKF